VPRAPVSLARALSKLGFCSRAQAVEVIAAGRVRLDGRIERDPDARLDLARARILVDGQPIAREAFVYLMLNKPAGLVVTESDEKGRRTVFECLRSIPDLPRVVAVGRLDQASEGLLLFTNDTQWANAITDPASHLDKTYHVQVSGHPTAEQVARMLAGVRTPEGDTLRAKHVRALRQGERNTWLEILLDEGKNRHLRRLLAALGFDVLRLIRVAIGPLQLGNLPKAHSRFLTSSEVRLLSHPPR